MLSKLPSSGISINKAKAVISETPGMDKRISNRSELRISEDKLFDRGVDLLDFELYFCEALLVLLFEQGKRDRLGAVFSGSAMRASPARLHGRSFFRDLMAIEEAPERADAEKMPTLGAPNHFTVPVARSWGGFALGKAAVGAMP